MASIPKNTARAARPFVVHEYVRWGDVDPAGIIRYDAYLRFFEYGESEFFRALGIPYWDLVHRFKVGIPRRVMHADFVSPAVLDEQLEIRVYISHIGTTSMKMHFDIYSMDGVARELGYLVFVCVDPGTSNKRAWPPELLQLLQPYVMPNEGAGAS
jgi:acyl-CoA thioester hydrolase